MLQLAIEQIEKAAMGGRMEPLEMMDAHDLLTRIEEVKGITREEYERLEKEEERADELEFIIENVRRDAKALQGMLSAVRGMIDEETDMDIAERLDACRVFLTTEIENEVREEQMPK